MIPSNRTRLKQLFLSGFSALDVAETLRNNLAHAQDIVTSDWITIVRLAENLDRVLD